MTLASSWRPFWPLDFVFRALGVLTAQVVWPTQMTLTYTQVQGFGLQQREKAPDQWEASIQSSWPNRSLQFLWRRGRSAVEIAYSNSCMKRVKGRLSNGVWNFFEHSSVLECRVFLYWWTNDDNSKIFTRIVSNLTPHPASRSQGRKIHPFCL